MIKNHIFEDNEKTHNIFFKKKEINLNNLTAILTSHFMGKVF